jgi:hypothetical protein
MPVDKEPRPRRAARPEVAPDGITNAVMPLSELCLGSYLSPFSVTSPSLKYKSLCVPVFWRGAKGRDVTSRRRPFSREARLLKGDQIAAEKRG